MLSSPRRRLAGGEFGGESILETKTSFRVYYERKSSNHQGQQIKAQLLSRTTPLLSVGNGPELVP